jgi:hypothetical protein
LSNDIEIIIAFGKSYKKNVIYCYGGDAIMRRQELLCSAFEILANFLQTPEQTTESFSRAIIVTHIFQTFGAR